LTETTQELRDEVLALEEGRAFADRSSYRKTLVTGDDAGGWLNDLLTARLAGLAEGSARRSLLLTPTGRIRADVVVAAVAGGFLLLQDPVQPDPIGDLLAPYVLSSDVLVADRTSDLALFSVPGTAAARPGWSGHSPSVLGEGRDILAATGAASRIRSMMNEQLVEVGDEALEIWRIRGGVPRFPVDLDGSSLPAEAGLEALIDTQKGCFLGQESVAKVRNLGHPPRVLRAVGSDGDMAVGDGVFSGSVRVGEVTSAAPASGGGTACIVRIGWGGAAADITALDGTALRRPDERATPPPGRSTVG
jgi:folate-binding protein YgfZ